VNTDIDSAARDTDTTAPARPGPLAGTRVLVLAALGPTPFTGMVLGDLGADVLRLTRPGGPEVGIRSPRFDILGRHQAQAAVDLKASGAADLVLDLAERADVFVEGFRPGVAERLGVGPEPCLAANPSLVYARVTGWGQDGPNAAVAGHDINYLAATGALALIGEAGRKPVPPLSMVGDFGAGGMLTVVGILAALLEARRTGQGQVIDVAMVDAISLLLSSAHAFHGSGGMEMARGSNLLDGGAPFYDTYRCSDGEYVAVGAIEAKFFAELVRVLEIDPTSVDQRDRQRWPQLRALLADAFIRQPRVEWERRFRGVDACVNAVRWLDEASADPHLAARGTLSTVCGTTQPSPAPRFSRTPGPALSPLATPDPQGSLAGWGVDGERFERLCAGGVVIR
jgi:alpha-methylacyl-CoA racemase